MKVLKKIGKVMAVLFLVLMLGLAALDIYLIKMPELIIPGDQPMR